jgi:hypothetical protein
LSHYVLPKNIEKIRHYVTFQCSKIDNKLIGFTVTTTYSEVLEWFDGFYAIKTDEKLEKEFEDHM